MSDGVAIAGIAAALLIGAISPGPSFVLMAQTAVAGSRRQGVLAAAGMGIGGVAFATLALAGLHVLLVSTPWLDTGLRLSGGAYLVYLGWRLWPKRVEPWPFTSTIPDATRSDKRCFWLGLLTQLSNPKTAIVYASIFASLLPSSLDLASEAVLLGMVLLVEGGWYCLVALVFSSARPRALYQKARPRIDRIAASVMGVLGVRLILSNRL